MNIHSTEDDYWIAKEEIDRRSRKIKWIVIVAIITTVLFYTL